MTTQLIINSQIEGQTEEMDGSWRAIQEELGLYAYGDTPEEASSRLVDALNLLVDVLLEDGGIDAVTNRFEKAGINFTVNDEQEDGHRTLPLMLTFAKTFERT